MKRFTNSSFNFYYDVAPLELRVTQKNSVYKTLKGLNNNSLGFQPGDIYDMFSDSRFTPLVHWGFECLSHQLMFFETDLMMFGIGASALDSTEPVEVLSRHKNSFINENIHLSPYMHLNIKKPK